LIYQLIEIRGRIGSPCIPKDYARRRRKMSGVSPRILCLFLLLPITASGQSKRAPEAAKNVSDSAVPADFPPLDQWKAAVLAGDHSALTSLYMVSPAARAKTPRGTFEDPSEEPLFWAGLAAKGLEKLKLKVLQVQRPQPGVVVLVLRIEMVVGVKSAAEPEVVSGAQVWVHQGDDWRIYFT
jgi:hypothetical protein